MYCERDKLIIRRALALTLDVIKLYCQAQTEQEKIEQDDFLRLNMQMLKQTSTYVRSVSEMSGQIAVSFWLSVVQART